MSPQVYDARFQAMGADCHVRIVGRDDTPWAVAQVRRLERLWTRFDDSELTRIGPVLAAVDPDTALLVERALEAYELTEGSFNPFMADQIAALGYDRDFGDIDLVPVVDVPAVRSPTVRFEGDMVSSSAPIDSGGIGKGLGADIVCERLMERGASGALVNLGGDLRCVGQAPQERWDITITPPVTMQRDLSVKLSQGAVCTSTPRLRTWVTQEGVRRHHLLDPDTGEPAETEHASVSVIAPQAWLAEALCKAAFFMPQESLVHLLRQQDAVALFVSDSGVVRQV